ncbi:MULTISPECIES: hypothetical protein [unclassified Acinetobacter]|uniref:hypothetical protein n=1 Tax=unclassified Acinetobacter TaxID=196816 RepID=UPI00124DAFAF|nr:MULTISPECIES: hypothetical protein [unclassified Acinetobacter]
MSYWKVVTETILGDAGISFTDEQLEEVYKNFESASEMQSEATGEMYIRHNPEAIELEKLKKEKADHEKWLYSTEPCKACYQTGVSKDSYGRDCTCRNCDGKGRTNRGYWG